MNRILVIRGGAIGDFILTLPALNLLRRKFPDAHLEILGESRVVALAVDRFYANAARSINCAPLSRFFVANAELPSELANYFASFDLVVSYVFDPDATFANNLRRSGVASLIVASPKFHGSEHAAQQLARPLEAIGLHLESREALLHLNESDRDAARRFLDTNFSKFIALHPGSGSQSKNWPIQKWIALGEILLSEKRPLLVVGGEAEEEPLAHLRLRWREKPVRFAVDLPLPTLGALLQRADGFVGHDSGVSHLAAAVGTQCLLLFGPTDPAIWAPANANVRVVRAPAGNLRDLSVATVRQALAQELMRIGIST